MVTNEKLNKGITLVALVITIVILLICWNRYKERAYYYAREVLNEYLKKNKQ